MIIEYRHLIRIYMLWGFITLYDLNVERIAFTQVYPLNAMDDCRCRLLSLPLYCTLEII